MVEFTFVEEESTKEYRVLPGQAHYHKGEKHTGGQVVPLTDRQYKVFKDKFTPTEETGDTIAKKLVEEDSKKFVLESAGGTKYNVFLKSDMTVAVNEKPLTKSKAEELAASKEKEK